MVKKFGADRDVVDAQLSAALIRCGEGDSQAFKTVYTLTAPKLTAIIDNMVGNPHQTKDILQNAYLSIWKNAASYDPARGRPFTWMLVITRNRAIDLLRKQTRRKEEEPVGSAMVDLKTPRPDMATKRRMLREQLAPALQKLPTHVRDAILMHVVDDYTTAEIGVYFDVPTNTAKSWVRRGLRKLRKTVRPELLATLDD